MKKFSCNNSSHLQEALTGQRRTPWQRKLREGWLTSVHALPQWVPVLRHSSLVQNCFKVKVKHAQTLSRLFVSLPYAGPGLMRLAGSTIAQRIDDPRIAYRETRVSILLMKPVATSHRLGVSTPTLSSYFSFFCILVRELMKQSR
jgi:hypothetical protein